MHLQISIIYSQTIDERWVESIKRRELSNLQCCYLLVLGAVFVQMPRLKCNSNRNSISLLSHSSAPTTSMLILFHTMRAARPFPYYSLSPNSTFSTFTNRINVVPPTHKTWWRERWNFHIKLGVMRAAMSRRVESLFVCDSFSLS